MTAFQRFSRLHFWLMIAQVVAAAALVWLFVSDPPARPDPNLDRILQVVALIFAGVGYFGGSMWLFQSGLKKIHAMPDEPLMRFTAFQRISILQWALLMGPYLFCWTCFFLTGNLSYPALAVFLLVFFLLLRPNALRVAIQLRVREQDLLQLK
jgi:hypothetical protein